MDRSARDRIGRRIAQAQQRDRGRSRRVYDGVLGKLPEWVPEYHHGIFHDTRNRLLDTELDGVRVTPHRVRAWIDRYMKGEAPNVTVTFPPEPVREDVWTLKFLRDAVQKGSVEGLRMLAGDGAVRGAKILSAAQRGHALVHGTREQKAKRWGDFQAEVDRLRAAHPGHSTSRIQKLAADKLGVSAQTIKRRTKR